MWKILSLILPVLVPSWRFFRAIEPSPRVQWTCSSPDGELGTWREVYPRPQTMSVTEMFRRLFWNPAWNEALFLVTCAERLQRDPGPNVIHEIELRVSREIQRVAKGAVHGDALFRLVLVDRRGAELVEEVVFISAPFPVQFGGRA